MPIGDRSILEIVVSRLAAQGFSDITLCVGYLSHLIRAVSDHLEEDGAQISFVQEQDALGTAAPLRLLDGLDDTFVVMNGDVLTTLDFRDLVDHHHASGNALTIATRQRTIKIDYGVLHVGSPSNGSGDGSLMRPVVGFEEKPEVVSTVSMGIYVLEPSVLGYIPDEGHFDFPDLVEALLTGGERVGAYIFDGLWFDIGRHEDFERAVTAWTSNGAPDASVLLSAHSSRDDEGIEVAATARRTEVDRED